MIFNTKIMKTIPYLIFLAALIVLTGFSITETIDKPEKDKDPLTDTLYTNKDGLGIDVIVSLTEGKNYNHPLIAVWVETLDEEYLQTLYVSNSIAKGVYEHGDASQGKWLPGEKRRPAALPYWSHQRNVKESDGLYIPTSKTPMPDAYSGATPLNDFMLITKTDKKPVGKFRLMFEINQPFDFNEFWHNTLYPDDENYKTSGQPSIIYSVTIDTEKPEKIYFLNPIGHGHFSGSTGDLFTDLSTLSTALEIVEKIQVHLK